MLARTTSARYTKDTDMVYEGDGIDEAIEELRGLSSIDLGDHLEYRLVSASPIVEEQEYREGCRVVFEAVLGGTKTIADVSVDLVVNDAPLTRTDTMAPAARLPIEGLEHFDYVVYPVEESVADKVCATMATYPGGRRSSRVRDLVDLVIYLTTENLDGNELARCLDRELRMGHMGERRPFSVPEAWHGLHTPTYLRLATDSRLEPKLRDVHSAEVLVAKCVDVALYGRSFGMTWDHTVLAWLGKDDSTFRNPHVESATRVPKDSTWVLRTE